MDDQIIKLLNQVAKLMDGWRFDNRDEHTKYLIKDGVKLFVRTGCTWRANEQDRLYLSGVLPKHYLERSRVNKISVSSKRTPRVLAKDIKNRLVEPFLKELDRQQKLFLERDRKHQKLKTVTDLIKSLPYTSVIDSPNGNSEYRKEFSVKTKSVHARFEVSGSYTATVSVSGLNNDQLVKLAYFLTQL